MTVSSAVSLATSAAATVAASSALEMMSSSETRSAVAWSRIMAAAAAMDESTMGAPRYTYCANKPNRPKTAPEAIIIPLLLRCRSVESVLVADPVSKTVKDWRSWNQVFESTSMTAQTAYTIMRRDAKCIHERFSSTKPAKPLEAGAGVVVSSDIVRPHWSDL